MPRLLFRQLTGDRKTLELADHAAPHGRSHGNVALSDQVAVREAEAYCGGNNVPTRHLFGLKHEPWEPKGRFSDYWGGEGFAQAKAAEVKRFVADQQPVHISWGESLSATGLILEFKPDRETEADIEWTLKIAIDSDELIGQVIELPTRKAPQDFVNQIILHGSAAVTAYKDLPLKLTLFETLDSLISNVSAATGFVVSVAAEVQSFERDFIGAIRRFRTALGQLKTAAVIARDAIDALQLDAAIEAHDANSQLSFASNTAIFSDSTYSMIRQCAEADRQAAIAERGRIRAIYEAKSGDTFESIAAANGLSGRAEDIRVANGVSSGQPPVSGVLYILPV